METRYTKRVDTSRLNGFLATYEASSKAAPEVFTEAYRLALAYGTPLVDSYNDRTIYIDPAKYTLDEIRAGAWKSDPTIYEKPAILQ